MSEMLINDAEAYLKKDDIVSALDSIVRAKQLGIPNKRIDDVTSRILKRRKKLADKYMEKAKLYLGDNNIKKAIFYLKKILEIWPDNKKALSKLKKLGVTLKELTVKAEQYQEKELSVLENIKLQSQTLKDAIDFLNKLEKQRKIKEALKKAKEFYKNFGDEPSIKIKLDLYEKACKIEKLYKNLEKNYRLKKYNLSVSIINEILKSDQYFRYGFLLYPIDKIIYYCFIGADSAINIKKHGLALKLKKCLEELGGTSNSIYLEAKMEFQNGNYRKAIVKLHNVERIAKKNEKEYMQINLLLAEEYFQNYKLLFFVIIIQIVILVILFVKTFLLADEIVDHELTKKLFMKERELGYYISRCNALISDRKWRKAEKMARYILSRDPNIPQAKLWRAICRYWLKDRTAAYKMLQQFLREFPRHREANFYMGLLEDLYNKPSKAIEHLELARGISGAARDFNPEDIAQKGNEYYRIFSEYKQAAADVLGIKLGRSK